MSHVKHLKVGDKMSVPNTTVKLLSGVPLDNTYTDSIYFDSLSAQQTYFNSKVTRTFSAMTYQRIGRNKIRVQVESDNIYNCNYLMFQNTSFGSKWFYAFIVDTPEYINDNVTEITYEIDVIQTYLFDVVLKPCFVEREHQATDEIGDNVLPEPVDTGDFKSYYSNNVVFDSYDVVVAHAPFSGS